MWSRATTRRRRPKPTSAARARRRGAHDAERAPGPAAPRRSPTSGSAATPGDACAEITARLPALRRPPVDAGHRLRVEVTAKNASSSATATSDADGDREVRRRPRRRRRRAANKAPTIRFLSLRQPPAAASSPASASATTAPSRSTSSSATSEARRPVLHAALRELDHAVRTIQAHVDAGSALQQRPLHRHAARGGQVRPHEPAPSAARSPSDARRDPGPPPRSGPGSGVVPASPPCEHMFVSAASRRSCTPTSTRSTRRSSSATTRACAGGR